MNVTLKDLKKELSVILKRVSNGEIVVATKHNKPYIKIITSERLLISIGSNFGKIRLKNKIKLSESIPSTLSTLGEYRNES